MPGIQTMRQMQAKRHGCPISFLIDCERNAKPYLQEGRGSDRPTLVLIRILELVLFAQIG
jgi:hypothetical protein